MNRERKLWIGFALVMGISFAILGYFGYEIYQQAPPIPSRIISVDNKTIFTEQEIKDGQNIWQSMGGQEVGTIWGHGAYVAPDWTADWLHREAVFILDGYAKADFGTSFSALKEEQQAGLKIRLQKDVRKNTFNVKTNTITISKDRIAAVVYLSSYYKGLFMDDPKFDQLRHDYAIPKMSIKEEQRMHKMNAFFFWATWATVTERPGAKISYTHNWPSDELVGNVATSNLLIWSGVSIILLIFCIASNATVSFG